MCAIRDDQPAVGPASRLTCRAAVDDIIARPGTPKP